MWYERVTQRTHHRERATTSTTQPTKALVDAVERAGALDSPGKALGKRLRGLVGPGAVKDALSGTWLGHAVHPPLTDVVIGSFLGASILDVTAPSSGEASERLLQVGLLAALPTAVTGASDWADTEIADERVRRVGLVHAAVNVSALALAAGSLIARRRGSLATGRALAAASNGALGAGGLLGGHLSFTRGVGPNQTAFDAGPGDWTPVADAGDLPDGELVSKVAGETPVLLVRHGDGVHAIHDRCSHRGCSLGDGELDGHVVTCPCHGSQFDVRDGSVVRGPATAEQPAFDTRESDGRVAVRLQGAG
ncbi:MAG TPA: Rieske 2Fe-2S domain-containing protein [Thermoleophilaceae bacterium]|nr:Rieske 2Fe-2S domain-containing protein [Thermoleophilaceae bacterium]